MNMRGATPASDEMCRGADQRGTAWRARLPYPFGEEAYSLIAG
jgi:hypothetical protein